MINICLPAKVFLIVTVIFCLWSYSHFRNDYKKNKKLFFIELSIDILALVFFTWLLNYLCINNYKNTSWFLFIIYLVSSITVIYVIKREKLSYFEATGIRP